MCKERGAGNVVQRCDVVSTSRALELPASSQKPSAVPT